jgi:hypothetical protein
VGSIFGFSAMAKANEAKSDGCAGKLCPTEAGVTATKDALGQATASTVGFIAGGVLAAGGIVLILTAPSGVQVSPSVGAGYGGVSLTGAW